MPAVASSSLLNRIERQNTRDALFSDDDLSDPDASEDEAERKPVVRGRGRGRPRGRGRGGRGRGSGTGRGRGRGRGGANAPALVHADDTEVAPGITRRTMSGILPYFNDFSNVLVDDDGRRIFIYGGSRPGAPADDPGTADFYVCHVEQAFLWEDWTELLGHPFQKPLPLPRLKCASATYLAMNGCEYVFLFGGFNSDCDGTTSALIAIDVATKMWSYVDIEGTVIARVDAAFVGVKNRLYVFGGRKDFEDGYLSSYSIAEYKDCSWRWIVCDKPYPIHVPGLGYDGRALSVFNGVKIMLTAGRLRWGRSPIQLTKRNTFFFHTEHETFSSADDTHGEFPEDLQWNYIYHVKMLCPLSTSTGTSKVIVKQEPIVVDPFALICGWVSIPGSTDLAPEIWKLVLPPVEKMQCLNIRQKILDLEMDLQCFVSVGGRFFFLGSVNADTYSLCIEVDLQALEDSVPAQHD